MSHIYNFAVEYMLRTPKRGTLAPYMRVKRFQDLSDATDFANRQQKKPNCLQCTVKKDTSR